MPNFIAYLPKNGNFSKDLKVAKEAAWGINADMVELQAESIEHVYAQLNHGSGCELAGYQGRSLSVGDVVVADGGKAWMCDSFGWTELKND